MSKKAVQQLLSQYQHFTTMDNALKQAQPNETGERSLDLFRMVLKERDRRYDAFAAARNMRGVGRSIKLRSRVDYAQNVFAHARILAKERGLPASNWVDHTRSYVHLDDDGVSFTCEPYISDRFYEACGTLSVLRENGWVIRLISPQLSIYSPDAMMILATPPSCLADVDAFSRSGRGGDAGAGMPLYQAKRSSARPRAR